MSHTHAKQLVLALLLTFAGSAHGQVVSINWFTAIEDENENLLFSNYRQADGLTQLTGGFSFELGVFSSAPDFTSIGSTVASSGNFVRLGSQALTSWQPDVVAPGIGYAQMDGITFNPTPGYPAGASAGLQVFAWVYNSKADASTSQWAFVTNPNWILPAIPTSPGSIELREWGSYQPDTLAAWGMFNALDNTFVLTAIPEPATYALLLGAASLGVVVIRRRRAARQLATAAGGDA